MGEREKDNELLLCVPTAGAEVGYLFRDGPWLPVGMIDLGGWLSRHAEWRRRGRLEQDSSFRHFSTYAILRAGGRILTYRRDESGSEGRLHGRRSCGVGGHVEIRDLLAAARGCRPGGLPACWAAALDSAAVREVAEEIGPSWAREGHRRFLGLIASGESAVSRVHLGYVVEWTFGEARPPLGDVAELRDPRWLHPREFLARPEPWEPWSRILLSRLLPAGPERRGPDA